MKPVRFGIVSTAKIARDWVIPAMQAVPECEVVAISSREIARAHSVAQEFGISRYYGSLADMLADDVVDAVYIPTPNSDHVPEAIQALKAGRHVLCEKPLGLDSAEAEKLLAVQRQTGLEVSEAFMVRYQPRWLAAREIIRSGRLGRVTQIHAAYSVMNDNAEDIRFSSKLGGGALGDVGVYPITAARFLFEDEPVAVTATFEKQADGGVDIAVAGMMEFPGHRNLLFSGALLQAWSHFINVIGTKGWMEIPISVWPSDQQETAIHIRGRDDLFDAQVETIRFDPANQYQHEVSTFARVVRGELEQPWPLSNAVAGMRILDAVRLSASTNSKVPIDLSA